VKGSTKDRLPDGSPAESTSCLTATVSLAGAVDMQVRGAAAGRARAPSRRAPRARLAAYPAVEGQRHPQLARP
jgi:hypothetical protein